MATSSQASPYQVAEIYAWRGDSAFEWLDRPYAGCDPGVCDVKADPLLRSLRGDPRLAALLTKLRLPPD